MDVERAETIAYALPFRKPYVTSRGRLDRRELILFRLTSAEGIVGLGETTSLSLRGGRTLAEIVAELEEIGRRVVALEGDDGWGIPATEVGIERFSPEARCAYYTAILDLAARFTGPSMTDWADPVPCNATLSSGPPARVAETALEWSDRGFETFKLKVGGGGDVAQVRAVREALGPEPRIRIDANGIWSADEAVAILAELEPLGIELCEQPVATLEEMAEVRKKSAVPLAADESVATPEDARRARELGACDLVTLKMAKVGGHGAATGENWELPAYISSALDGPVGIAAAGFVPHVLERNGSDAGIAHGLATQLLFSETIASLGPEVRDGMLHLPAGPGLGVEIDEDALARLRLSD